MAKKRDGYSFPQFKVSSSQSGPGSPSTPADSGSPTRQSTPQPPLLNSDIAQTRYITSVALVSQDQRSQEDYKVIRNETMSHGILYYEEVWPEVSQFIVDIRNMSQDFLDMNPEQYEMEIQDLLEECELNCEKAEKLKRAHVSILKSLNALKGRVDGLVGTLEVGVDEKTRVSKQYRTKARLLQGVTVASCLTIVGMVGGYFSHKYGKRASEKAKNEASAAQEQQETIEDVHHVQYLVDSMAVFFEDVAQKADGFHTELQRVNGYLTRAARGRKDRVYFEMSLGRSQGVSNDLVPRCEEFLRARIGYEVAMRKVQEEEAVNHRFRVTWKEHIDS